MREYKSEVFRLKRDLREQKEQALTMKNQFSDWNKKLQDRVREYRNEKTAWLSEAAALRAADKEAKVGSVRFGIEGESDGVCVGNVCGAEETVV